jgi:hypothetical protein
MEDKYAKKIDALRPLLNFLFKEKGQEHGLIVKYSDEKRELYRSSFVKNRDTERTLDNVTAGTLDIESAMVTIDLLVGISEEITPPQNIS